MQPAASRPETRVASVQAIAAARAAGGEARVLAALKVQLQEELPEAIARLDSEGALVAFRAVTNGVEFRGGFCLSGQ